MYIEACEEVSAINFKCVFSLSDYVIEDIKNEYERIKAILDIFYSELDDVKIAVDVKYTSSSLLDMNQEKVKNIFLSQDFEQYNTNRDNFRRIFTKNKYNIVENIDLYPYRNNMTNSYTSISVDNVIVNFDLFFEQLITTAYFYMIHYCKLHYNYIKDVDKDYVKENEKFYNKLESLS